MTYHLQIVLPLSTETDFEGLLQLEGELQAALLPSGAKLLSHQLGEAEMTLLIDCDDVADSLDLVGELIALGDWPGVRIEYRAHTADHFIQLWPEPEQQSQAVEPEVPPHLH